MINQRARAAFERGQEWQDRGNHSKAINAYREAIAIEPDWTEPYLIMGSLYVKSGRYDEARATYRQVKPLLAVGDGSVDNSLSVIERIQQGELDPAALRFYLQARDLPDEQLDAKMALCQDALGLNPTFAAPYSILGKILLAKGHPNQARAVLERGLACNPSPFIQAMLLFNLGAVHLVCGLRKEALALFRQVVALDANPTATRFASKQLQAAAAGRI